MIKKGTKVVGVWGAYFPDSFGVVTHSAKLCKIEWDGKCGNFKENPRTYIHHTEIKPSYKNSYKAGVYVNDL